MARTKSRKPKRGVDEFGPQDMPFMTNQQTLDAYGITAVRAITDKRRKATSLLYKTAVIVVVGAILLSWWKAISLKNDVVTLRETVAEQSSHAFRTRYDDIGKQIVKAYFAGAHPPVNVFDASGWPSLQQAQSGDSFYQARPGAGGGKAVEFTDIALLSASSNAFNASQIDDDVVREKFTKPSTEILVYSATVGSKTYTVTVDLAVPDTDNPSILPYLMHPPTLQPGSVVVSAAGDLSKPSPGGDFNFRSSQPTPAAIQAITQWASAYAEDDGDALKRLTGDTEPSRMYRGVGGFSLSGNPAIKWSYSFTFDGDTDNMLVRVSFAMSQVGSKNSGEKPFTPTQSMDLMLTHFDSGTPNIVAWGAAGTWNTLSAYMNAVDTTSLEGDSWVSSSSSAAKPKRTTTTKSTVPSAKPVEEAATSTPRR